MVDTSKLQAVLEEELRKYLASLANSNIKNIQGERTNTQSISDPSPSALQSQPIVKDIPESIAPVDDNGISGQEKLFLQLYREFVKKDEAKELASGLHKFARFAQSEISKLST